MKKFLSIIMVFIMLFLFVGAWSLPISNKDAIKEARKYAEENLLPKEGITGISHDEKQNKKLFILNMKNIKIKYQMKLKVLKQK